MFFIFNRAPRLIGVALVVLVLAGCQNLLNDDAEDRSTVTVDSNAYYAVFKKSEHDEWRIMRADNTGFAPKTMTMTVSKSAPYGAVFVCPAQRAGEKTEVHIYYATSTEMRFLDFSCRKALDDTVDLPVYGDLKGIETADYEHPTGDVVRLALSDEVTFDAWESYAANVRLGKRDFIGVKGLYESNVFKPKSLLVRRNIVVSAKTGVVNLDFAQDNDDLTAFSEASRSMVNIEGLQAEEQLEADVSFISLNKTSFSLEKSINPSFDFLPMPLEKITTNNSSFIASDKFHPSEGHVLSVLVKSQEGLVARQSLKLFTESNGEAHDLYLPKNITTSPLLLSKITNELQEMVLQWERYQDEKQGAARLYQWKIAGVSAEFLEDKEPAFISNDLEWHVTVTHEWLTVIGADKESIILSLPTYFEIGDKQGEITEHDYWRREWSFRPDTSTSWEMSVATASAESTTESLVDYLTNKNVTDDFQFSQVFVRSK